jgi:sugar phosphate isomerase/epimerase
MKLAYNSNGWRHLPLETMFTSLAEIGYQGVELGVQPNHVAPCRWSQKEAQRIKGVAEDVRIAISNLHLGAENLLSDTPHEPSFMAAYQTQRDQRIDLMRRGCDFAAELGVSLVCLESGPLPPDMSRAAGLGYLIEGVEACITHARETGVRLGLEPSPAHLLNGYGAYLELCQVFGPNPSLGLCLDIGHSHCVFEDTIAIIGEASDHLFHVHIEDIANREHRHLPLGDGSIDLKAVLSALQARGYEGYVSVELADHFSAPESMSQQSHAYLRNLLDDPSADPSARRATRRAPR